jgi:hypothetical protein
VTAVDETVELMPPLTRGLGRTDGIPLQRGPRYLRTREMGRWHRVRSGVHYERWGHTAWHLWCGQSAHQNGRRGVDCLTAAEPVDGAPVCGTCQGRAVGAGQEPAVGGMPDLVFSPRRLTSPTQCPGSRSEALWEPIPDGVNVGRCLACGVIATVRVSGGAYNPRVGLVVHRPGPGLVPGCAFHAWSNLARHETPDGPVARCGCGQAEAWAGEAS